MAQYGADGNRDHLDEALLSDFLDDRIEDAETVLAVRSHLGRCDDCRQALADLRTITALLADLPAPALPRSFRLTPEMVPVRLVMPEPWFQRFQPTMRWATVAAALLLVLVLSADLLSQRAGNDQAPVMMSVGAQVTAAAADASGGGSRSAASAAQEPTAAGAAAAPEAAPAGGAQAGSLPDQAAAPDHTTADAAAGATAPAPAALAAPADPPAAAERQPGTEVAGYGAEDAAETAIAAPVPSAQPVSGWRVAELALGLVILWLLIAIVALPRLRPGRR